MIGVYVSRREGKPHLLCIEFVYSLVRLYPCCDITQQPTYIMVSSVGQARAGLKALGLGRVLAGSGLTKGEPEPAVRAWAGYGPGLGLGPGLL